MNVHVVVSARSSRNLERAVSGADLALPDGAPIAWALRRLGFGGQPRIAGPDFMWHLCARCAEAGVAVFFYGSTTTTLDSLIERVRTDFPTLSIVGSHAPPFRELTREEDDRVIQSIEESRAGLLFIGLGCPKQELWMAAHRGRIRSVMLGVGAAFDFHAGSVSRAPVWMQRVGLEWLHRLLSEPRRLWKRYLVTSAVFIVLLSQQIIGRWATGILKTRSPKNPG